MTTEEKLSIAEQERDSFTSQLTELRGCYERLLKTAFDYVQKHVSAMDSDLATYKSALEKAREALEPRGCETCGGTRVFKFECPGCLSGEAECTCDKQELEPCPQCQSSDDMKAYYQMREDALTAIDAALSEGCKS